MITEKVKTDLVSVVIPIYNEEKFIRGLVKSIEEQDYDKNKFEVIFIDGNSTDKTVEILNKELNDKNINYKIIYNPEKITPKSVNMGIKEAKNEIIIRLDAHSEYPQNYISKCVYYINNIDADNVGCTVKTISDSMIGKIIANVVSSKFGVGNSSFRTNSDSGYVDTVPFGTFKKELFDKIGYFNEELPRSEDNEFNNRIIKSGGKVYLFNDIQVIYHPRETIYQLMRMGFDNGKWATYTGYIIPGSMKLRHFIPLFFVLGLILGIIVTLMKIELLAIIFGVILALYLLLDIIFTIKNIISDGLMQAISLIIYPLFHISYGIGSIFGIGKIIRKVVKK